MLRALPAVQAMAGGQEPNPRSNHMARAGRPAVGPHADTDGANPPSQPTPGAAGVACSRAAVFVAERARAERGPSSSLTSCRGRRSAPPRIEDNERRHPTREAELARGKRDIAAPAAEAIRAVGVDVRTVVRHGHPAQTLCDLAEEHGVTQLVVGRTGETRLRAALFGSVPSSLVQISPVPVTVVP